MRGLRELRPLVLAALVALALLPAPGVAQGVAQGGRQGGGPPPGERDSLEARVRERMGHMLRTQLGLTDAQVRQLQATNRRFEGQRRTLLQQEREVRNGLRTAIDSDDTTRVSAMLDRMFALQRQRLDLIEAEQKELATFHTPVQRARLFGLEEQLRRRMAEMRENRAEPRPLPGRRPDDRPPGPGGARRPPPR
jgi:Spy/CpxP family protein refolding chaperone